MNNNTEEYWAVIDLEQRRAQQRARGPSQDGLEGVISICTSKEEAQELVKILDSGSKS